MPLMHISRLFLRVQDTPPPNTSYANRAVVFNIVVNYRKILIHLSQTALTISAETLGPTFTQLNLSNLINQWTRSRASVQYVYTYQECTQNLYLYAGGEMSAYGRRKCPGGEMSVSRFYTPGGHFSHICIISPHCILKLLYLVVIVYFFHSYFLFTADGKYRYSMPKPQKGKVYRSEQRRKKDYSLCQDGRRFVVVQRRPWMRVVNQLQSAFTRQQQTSVLSVPSHTVRALQVYCMQHLAGRYMKLVELLKLPFDRRDLLCRQATDEGLDSQWTVVV